MALTTVIAATTVLFAGNGGAGAATPADTFSCPSEDLCLHLYDSSGNYHWVKYKKCVDQPIGPGEVPTWYINNQTAGTVSTFHYKTGDTWTTPPAFSKGRPGAPFYWGAPTSVQVC
ncbi:MAG TPA: hypothetical protein VHC49_18435 [Mycobacteriales bacterium]|nr:hypothetical protein [Mycobacteriales bacterium]